MQNGTHQQLPNIYRYTKHRLINTSNHMHQATHLISIVRFAQLDSSHNSGGPEHAKSTIKKGTWHSRAMLSGLQRYHQHDRTGMCSTWPETLGMNICHIRLTMQLKITLNTMQATSIWKIILISTTISMCIMTCAGKGNHRWSKGFGMIILELFKV